MTISTTAFNTSIGSGTDTTDVATLSGGVDPTGTIAFNLFGPGDATCSGTPVFTSVVTVTGSGTYSSAPVHLVPVGTYSWVAT